MNKLFKLLLVGAAFVSIAATVPVSAYALEPFKPCEGNPESSVCQAKDDSATDMIKVVINTLLYILGAIAVVMIIIGGIRYTTSGGDASGLKSAKDTILYSVVGLIVAMMALAIVNFVIGRF